LGDSPKWIIVQNDTAASVHAVGTDYADGEVPGIGTNIEAGQAGEVTWTQCKTAWLDVRAAKRVSSQEHGRFELELCPGDLVTLGPDYTVTIDEQ